MKKLLPIALPIIPLQSCQAIEGIFKAGAYTGAIVVILGIALIVFIIYKLVKK